MKKKDTTIHYCRQCLRTHLQKRQLGAHLCLWQGSWSGATFAVQEWAQARTAQAESWSSWRQGSWEGSWLQANSEKWENKKTSYPLSLVWSWFNRDFLWNSSTVLSSFYSLGDENAESSGCESFEILRLCFNQEVRVVWCLTWLGCKYFAPELLHWSNQEIKLRSSGFSHLCASNVKIWLQRISPISCTFSLLNCSVLREDYLNQYRIRNQV